MTKSQELELFRNLVSAFPDDSYIGEWLRQVDAEVESNLRSDIIPMISLRDSTRQCEAIVANANQRAASIVRQAEAQAESIVIAAKREEQHVRKVVNDAINVLERFR
jgi:hypothetical protein